MNELVSATSPLQERKAGVLLHPTSLPGRFDNGDLGPEAYHFIDFLHSAGVKVWQILPLGPTHGDRSPYQCISAYAGNCSLISVEQLQDVGLLTAEELAEDAKKSALMELAWKRFQEGVNRDLVTEWKHFMQREAYWLDDFVLYIAIRKLQGGISWAEWPAELRDRDPDALEAIISAAGKHLDRLRFEQFLFARQWFELKNYANERGISIFGDMPIFVSHDSSDVWAHREAFLLDENGMPTVVAGVPPDYFSATGQRWGNPHYDWERMREDGFEWWKERLRFQLHMFDLVRIDHFRGFEACWEIPANEETAINGHWVKVPGKELFDILHNEFEPLPIVAEDLGIITPEVEALRDEFSLPGMKILHFAFSDNAENPYLPHNHVRNSVVYTGTHDNDTTLGWLAGVDEQTRNYLYQYIGHQCEGMPWALVRLAISSTARLAVIPMQDLLELDARARMNTPGTIKGNWSWRFSWDDVDDNVHVKLHHLIQLYGRK